MAHCKRMHFLEALCCLTNAHIQDVLYRYQLEVTKSHCWPAQKNKKSSYFTVRRFSHSHISQHSSWVRIFQNSKNIKVCWRAQIHDSCSKSKMSVPAALQKRELDAFAGLYNDVHAQHHARKFADLWWRVQAYVHLSQDRSVRSHALSHSQGVHTLVEQDKGRNTSTHTCNSCFFFVYKIQI